jgi:hypothetical protein
MARTGQAKTEVDHGIRLPEHQTRYPWGKLRVYDPENEITDSFWLPITQATLSAMAGQYARRHGVKFTTRAEKAKDGSPGTRVWRIA